MQMNLIRFSGYINTLPSETFVHLSHDITFTFIRRFYPKRLTVHSDYKFFFLSVHVFPGNRTHNICAANAML